MSSACASVAKLRYDDSCSNGLETVSHVEGLVQGEDRLVATGGDDHLVNIWKVRENEATKITVGTSMADNGGQRLTLPRLTLGWTRGSKDIRVLSRALCLSHRIANSWLDRGQDQ